MTTAQFEVHTTRFTRPNPQRDDLDVFAADEEDSNALAVLKLLLDASNRSFHWVGADAATGQLGTVLDEADGVAGFTLVQRRLGPALGMVSRSPGVLVNAVPANGFAVLAPRDSLVLLPGTLTYVTERFEPHVGPPLAEHLGQRCPYDKIEITKDTRVVTCRCGCVYHFETSESHPDLQEEDRLNCLAKVRLCLSCNRPLTLEPVLVWNPAELDQGPDRGV
jgi:hypothetical protein